MHILTNFFSNRSKASNPSRDWEVYKKSRVCVFSSCCIHTLSMLGSRETQKQRIQIFGECPSGHIYRGGSPEPSHDAPDTPLSHIFVMFTTNCIKCRGLHWIVCPKYMFHIHWIHLNLDTRVKFLIPPLL